MSISEVCEGFTLRLSVEALIDAKVYGEFSKQLRCNRSLWCLIWYRMWKDPVVSHDVRNGSGRGQRLHVKHGADTETSCPP